MLNKSLFYNLSLMNPGFIVLDYDCVVMEEKIDGITWSVRQNFIAT